MVIHICWLTLHPDTIPRFYWDENWLEELLAGDVWRVLGLPTVEHHEGADAVHAVPDGEGAVVVLPARWHVDHIDHIDDMIARLPWLLLVLCGDEEGAFEWRKVIHPNMKVWVQTPAPHKHQGVDRKLGDYWPPQCRELLAGLDAEMDAKPRVWSFAGQVNNPRREQAVAAMRARERRKRDGDLLATAGFTQGFEYPEYLRRMAAAKVVPAPSGCFTQDSFRVFEALEAGCVPLADGVSPAWGENGYWEFLFDGPPPFPVVSSWQSLGDLVASVADTWPVVSNRVQAWWAARKRDLACWLVDDLAALGVPLPEATTPSQLVTALVPTSPIPAHPDTSILEETVASIRERLDCEIVLMIDGVRPEQEDRRADYEEYQRRLLRLAAGWRNVLPLRFEEHQHQAAMTAATLDHVRTPLILFVEHDTPLVGPQVEWDSLCETVMAGDVNLIRFLHEARVLAVHRHLVVGPDAETIRGVPLIKTLQYSQRPHLARADFYRRMLSDYFGPGSRSMIEDRIHGVVECDAHDMGKKRAWRKWKLAIYSPPEGGSLKRSTHSDGRAGDPKFDMDFGFGK